MAMTSKRKAPPSRIKYENNHPTVSCRVSKEIYERLTAEQALIAPAWCCLKNSGQVGAIREQALKDIRGSCVLQPEERLVEMAFEYAKMVFQILKVEFGLYNRP